MIRNLVFAALGLALAGCQAAPEGKITSEQSRAREVATSGQCGFVSPGLVYMDSVQRWREVAVSRGMMPAVIGDHDFSQQHLLLVAAGTKPSGGYRITLERSRIRKGELGLTMALTSPGADQMVTMALTSPCVVVAVPATGWQQVVVQGSGLGEHRLRR